MKNEWSIKFTLFFYFLFTYNGIATAQARWDDIIKSEQGIVAEQRQDVEISINDDGGLDIVARVYEETHYFSENANLYSEQSIGYSNTFSEIFDIEAYSLIPTGKNKFKKMAVDDFVTSDSRSSGVFYDDQKKIR